MSSKILLLNKNSSWGVQVDNRGNSAYDNVLSFASNELKEKYIIYTLYDKNESRTLNQLIEQEGIDVSFSQIDAANFSFKINNTNWKDRNKFLNKDFAILKENDNIYYLTILSANKNVSRIDYTAKLDVFMQYEIKDLFKDDNAIINQAHFKIESLEDITNEQFDTNEKNYILDKKEPTFSEKLRLSVEGNFDALGLEYKLQTTDPISQLRELLKVNEYLDELKKATINLQYFDKDYQKTIFSNVEPFIKWESILPTNGGEGITDIGSIAFVDTNSFKYNLNIDFFISDDTSKKVNRIKSWYEAKNKTIYGLRTQTAPEIHILDTKNLEGSQNTFTNLNLFLFRFIKIHHEYNPNAILKKELKIPNLYKFGTFNENPDIYIEFTMNSNVKKNEIIQIQGNVFAPNLLVAAFGLTQTDIYYKAPTNNPNTGNAFTYPIEADRWTAFRILNLKKFFEPINLNVDYNFGSSLYTQQITNDSNIYEKRDKYIDFKLQTSQFITRLWAVQNGSVIYNQDVDYLEDNIIKMKADLIYVPNLSENAISLIPKGVYETSKGDNVNIEKNISDNRYIFIKNDDNIPIKSDKLAEYLQLNKNKDIIQLNNAKFGGALGVAGGVIGLGASIATGNPFGVAASVTGIVGSAIKSNQSINANLAMKKDLANNPNLTNKTNSNQFITNYGNNIPISYLMTLYPDVLKQINDHFYRFGYNASNRYDKLNKYLDTRYWFNYLQASNIYELINKDISYNLKQEIASNIEKGLTINHIRKQEDFEYIKINQDLFNPFTK